jgi:hypothetical protein
MPNMNDRSETHNNEPHDEIIHLATEERNRTCRTAPAFLNLVKISEKPWKQAFVSFEIGMYLSWSYPLIPENRRYSLRKSTTQSSPNKARQ